MSLVSTGSVLGQAAVPYRSAYLASKFAITALIRVCDRSTTTCPVSACTGCPRRGRHPDLRQRRQLLGSQSPPAHRWPRRAPSPMPSSPSPRVGPGQPPAGARLPVVPGRVRPRRRATAAGGRIREPSGRPDHRERFREQRTAVIATVPGEVPRSSTAEAGRWHPPCSAPPPGHRTSRPWR